MTIIAITGPPGVGKTHWILRCLEHHQEHQIRYWSPCTDILPIDAICIQTSFPAVDILEKGEDSQALIGFDGVTYIELPWYLDLEKIESVLSSLNCYRVAILPRDSEFEPWQNWADEVHWGNAIAYFSTSKDLKDLGLQIHRGQLAGEVLDFDSLAVFWFELLQGAYGQVIRAKGIFDITTGESIYGDFVSGCINPEFLALDLPQWFKGRPERFSGLEICGYCLQKEAIAQTIKDCCLDDQQLHYYQQQIQSSILSESEESSL